MERSANSETVAIGDKAPYFSLKGTDNKIYSLKDFESARALAVVFTCNHCPYVKAWDPRLLEILKNFKSRGFEMVAICSNDPQSYPEDSFEHMVDKSESMDFAYPYLQDLTQEVARAYDAACTPEVFLFDSKQTLRYQGRIDDNHTEKSLVGSTDLADAVSALLSGEEVPTPLTSALGCSIKWVR